MKFFFFAKKCQNDLEKEQAVELTLLQDLLYSHNNQDFGERRQIFRSMKQDREFGNRSMHIWPIYF